MTPDEAIRIVNEKSVGRTRYEGREPFLDEVLVGEIERLRDALAACRKYADARLTDDPNDGLALVIEKIASARMGPLRDEAEGGE